MTEINAAMELRIKLLDVKPAVSRTLRVPISLRYDQLHVLIQLAFGWENYHMYSFQPKGQEKEYQAQISEMDFGSGEVGLASESYVYPDIAESPVTYTYDFGENWEHEITLKRVLTFDELGQQPLPACVTGRGANRVEDSDEEVGLPYNKNRLNDLLKLWSQAGEQMIRIDDLGLFPGNGED